MPRKKPELTTDDELDTLGAEIKGAMMRLDEAKSAMKAAATDLERAINGLLTPEEIERVEGASTVLPIREGDRISGVLGSLMVMKEDFKGLGKLAKELEQLSDKQRFAVAKVHQKAMVRADRERERIRREEDERMERQRRAEAERQQSMFNPSHGLPS